MATCGKMIWQLNGGSFLGKCYNFLTFFYSLFCSSIFCFLGYTIERTTWCLCERKLKLNSAAVVCATDLPTKSGHLLSPFQCDLPFLWYNIGFESPPFITYSVTYFSILAKSGNKTEFRFEINMHTAC